MRHKTLSFRDLVTEVFEFEYGNSKIINPTLQNNYDSWGIALYEVNADFCRK